MKKILGSLVAAVLFLVPFAVAVDVGTGIGLNMETESFVPLIWECDDRVVLDDDLEGGRDTFGGDDLDERVENYAFEGEQIEWLVLVMDKNGIVKVEDVYVTVGTSQGEGNDIEVNCQEDTTYDYIVDSCNARIGEEDLSGDSIDSNTQRYYTCTLTVESPASMYGEYWITAEVTDLDGNSNTFDENEYWFFNPTIALSVLGAIEFGTVRPGTIAYSDTLTVGNDADYGSGVLLDMFISGTDFYDPFSSGAMCPTTNRLKLGDQTFDGGGSDGEAHFDSVDDECDLDTGLITDDADHLCYFASNGAYSTQGDKRADAEGYVPIHYGTTFTTKFYNDAEIIATPSLITLGSVAYFAGNVLTPGAEIALTFKLGLPEPCNGDFSDGSLYFWGEAV